jgi:hypothetical protein
MKERNLKASMNYNNRAQRSFTYKNNKGNAQSNIGK